MPNEPKPHWNPYVAGVALGLVLTATYLLVGRGLGASGPALRIAAVVVAAVAPGNAAATPAFGKIVAEPHPFLNYYLFLALGTLLGGFVSAYSAGRVQVGVARGPTASIRLRLWAAAFGGVLLGIGARLARGCASGQALTGGGLLSAGSWAFMLAIFAGGYATVWFARREWR
ncbi:MAG TPA: YeeE/YedE thiosulfate transporter family protein [Anaeromyxobacteraceae bacterium]|nr:YeeE/YedE thiosulfate transporter family protein [Anaeromyxobacteraceae bacterium]